MSYVLHIWDKPVPKDPEEAWDIIEKLYGESSFDESINPSWFPLLQVRLLEKYRLHDDENTLGVWIDTSLENERLGYQLFCVGILSSEVENVQPFIAQTANSLGLVCFDMQEDIVYYPK